MKIITQLRSWMTKPNLTLAAMLSVCGVIVTLGSTSCATTKGFGRDVEKTGEKIQDAAR